MDLAVDSAAAQDPADAVARQEDNSKGGASTGVPTDGQLVAKARAPELHFHKCIRNLVEQYLRSQLLPFEAALTDPFKHARKQLGQLVSDMALTPEQQELFQRVVACNSRFWDVSVNGSSDGGDRLWKRSLSLNMALLRVYHCHVASIACREALGNIGDALPLPMPRGVAEEALRFSRWTAASYCAQWGSLPPDLSEADLVERAAAVAGVSAQAIFASRLCDADQANDPLCPRFLIALDIARGEVVFSVRGTGSVSDILANLIGDPVPFAGGLAHSGFCDAARCLLDRTRGSLREALEKLSGQGQKRRLILTGHSLGAGVAQLFAILLLGGDADTDSDDPEAQWRLPDDVELAMYLYAPPPVFCPGDVPVDGDEELVACARAAADAAMNSAIGFAMNYDIIPRTSLHNGYKLFQLFIMVDNYIPWRDIDVLSHLKEAAHATPERAASGVACIVEAVEASFAKAAATAPAPRNPFAMQFPNVAKMYHIAGAPGGTVSLAFGDLAGQGSRTKSGRLYKCSKHYGEWRSRWAWVESGELCCSHGKGVEEAKTRVPLTAGATMIVLLGNPSSTEFPGTIVVSSVDGGDAAEAVTYHETVTIREGRDLPSLYSPDDVIRAWYGAPGNEWTESKGVMVTDQLKQLLQEGKIVRASNDSFGDPSLMIKKILVVEVYAQRSQGCPKCPTGHTLKKEPVPYDADCDACDTRTAQQTPMWRCATCQHDLCDACAAKAQQVEGNRGMLFCPATATATATATGIPVKLFPARKPAPTPWSFRLETAATGGACPAEAASYLLCADSSASRDEWIHAMVDAISAARDVCYRVHPEIPKEDFGREALLADGFVDDHQVLRYEAALEGLVRAYDTQ